MSGEKIGHSPQIEECPIFQGINKHLAQEPSVLRIAVHGVADANRHFGGVDGSLQIAVYVTALVGFRQEIVEVKHRNRVVLYTEIRICVEVTADIVNLTVGYQEFRHVALIAVWQSLIEPHAPYDLGELSFCQASLRKRLQQMNVLCRTERIEQVKHLLVVLP